MMEGNPNGIRQNEAIKEREEGENKEQNWELDGPIEMYNSNMKRTGKVREIGRERR